MDAVRVDRDHAAAQAVGVAERGLSLDGNLNWPSFVGAAWTVAVDGVEKAGGAVAAPQVATLIAIVLSGAAFESAGRAVRVPRQPLLCRRACARRGCTPCLHASWLHPVPHEVGDVAGRG